MADRRLLRTSEVATALGVDRSTVYRWMQAGVISPEVTTHGGQARFDLDTVRMQLAAASEKDDTPS
ncbi:helix-turn-helix domain-containing protein [Pseudonocardia abyssalis]|uniref:Helix-turn-helix domain-containing protein n=1 Tax=Pseudonocardia abyssalis TaxID=2792008 RepID=A0ABS6UXC2_9PSEU|nr:helix-turn-helix domain-containing protein [Pseudonocardia abyssalis]MBW0136927.1 helix-turn-helix domain-containing protein [Pseudonocardia abyssalis]